jgi:hypothetical protein
MSPDNTPRPVRRKASIAWIYYGVLAVVGVVAGFQVPAAFLFAVACGAYSAYLFRGGRFVLWIW